MRVQEYLLNACGMRDGLSWDMLMLSQVPVPPMKNCFLRPCIRIWVWCEFAIAEFQVTLPLDTGM